MKKIIALSLLSLFLTACEKEEKSIKSEVEDHNPPSSLENNSSISQVSISDSGSNNIVMNSGSGIVTSNNGNIAVNGDSVTIMQSTSENNSPIIYINGQLQPVNHKDKIEIKPTGEKIKIPLPNKSHYEMNSFIPVEQTCSKEGSYLEVDSSLEPYINKEKLKNGIITMVNNNYQGNVNLAFNLVTPPLTYVKTIGISSTKITCVANSDFTWIDSGTGKNTLVGASLKKLKIETRGIGDFNLIDISVNEVHVEKSSMGNFNSKGHIHDLTLINSGMGNTSLENVDTLTLNHSGMGNITVSGKPKILKFTNTGMGSVNIY